MRDYNFLEKRSLLFKKQSVFCTKLSTKHALNYITNKIQVFSLYNNLVPKTKIKQNTYNSAPAAIMCVDGGK